MSDSSSPSPSSSSYPSPPPRRPPHSSPFYSSSTFSSLLHLPGISNEMIESRLMIPFTVCCLSCQNYIYRGKKFNGKKQFTGEFYLKKIKIFRFLLKCPKCAKWITFTSDPKNADYTMEEGGKRNFDPFKMRKEEQIKWEKEKMEREKDKEKDRETGNPLGNDLLSSAESKAEKWKKELFLNEQMELDRESAMVRSEMEEKMKRQKMIKSKKIIKQIENKQKDKQKDQKNQREILSLKKEKTDGESKGKGKGRWDRTYSKTQIPIKQEGEFPTELNDDFPPPLENSDGLITAKIKKEPIVKSEYPNINIKFETKRDTEKESESDLSDVESDVEMTTEEMEDEEKAKRAFAKEEKDVSDGEYNDNSELNPMDSKSLEEYIYQLEQEMDCEIHKGEEERQGEGEGNDSEEDSENDAEGREAVEGDVNGEMDKQDQFPSSPSSLSIRRTVLIFPTHSSIQYPVDDQHSISISPIGNPKKRPFEEREREKEKEREKEQKNQNQSDPNERKGKMKMDMGNTINAQRDQILNSHPHHSRVHVLSHVQDRDIHSDGGETAGRKRIKEEGQVVHAARNVLPSSSSSSTTTTSSAAPTLSSLVGYDDDDDDDEA